MQISTLMFCLLVAGVVVSLIFCCAFFVELVFNNPSKKNKKEENEDVKVEDPLKEEEELDLDKMLEKIDEQSKSEAKEEAKVEETKAEDNIDFDAMFARLEESIKKASDEEPKVEEVKEEVKEEKKEEKPSQTIIIVNEAQESSSQNYEDRLAKLNESLEKLEKDLAKSQKEINKYDRTAKRKTRNEKLLDKKAAELTNLNLVMYNVNDIKDVDPEKKQKQEELVAHIAELKQTITDADEYLVANKEKNANAKKLNSYLTKEKARYEEEIAELNKLIADNK